MHAIKRAVDNTVHIDKEAPTGIAHNHSEVTGGCIRRPPSHLSIAAVSKINVIVGCHKKTKPAIRNCHRIATSFDYREDIAGFIGNDVARIVSVDEQARRVI